MPNDKDTRPPALRTVVGNVGKDPELRYTTSGKAVCNLSLAVQQYPKQGQLWGDTDTDWITVTCWEEMAENVAASITKGTRIIAQGVPGLDKWKDKDGDFHVRKVITARAIGVELRWQTAQVAKAKPRAANVAEEAPF